MMTIKLPLENSVYKIHADLVNEQGGITYEEALRRLRSTRDDDLQEALLVAQVASSETAVKVAALAQVEVNARAKSETENLQTKTTRWSVIVGGAIAVIAAIIGALIQSR